MSDVYFVNPDLYTSAMHKIRGVHLMFTREHLNESGLAPIKWIKENEYKKKYFFIRETDGYIFRFNMSAEPVQRDVVNWFWGMGVMALIKHISILHLDRRMDLLIFLNDVPIVKNREDPNWEEYELLQMTIQQCSIWEFVFVGQGSFRTSFWDLENTAGAFDPIEICAATDVVLPSGLTVDARSHKWQPWANKFGLFAGSIKTDSERTHFNAMSILYAARKLDSRLPIVPDDPRDTISAYDLRKGKGQPGDKISCDSCSLAPKCTFAREGMVCRVPNSDGRNLSEFFGTDKAEDVLSGLNMLLEISAKRVERVLLIEEEPDFKGASDDVTKLIKGLFDMGVTFAKLRDPNLRGGTKVQIGINNAGSTPGSVVIGNGDPQQEMAEIRRLMLEDGIPESMVLDPLTIETWLRARQQEDPGRLVVRDPAAIENKAPF